MEEEILNRLDAHCNEAKRKRQSYENNSRRYSPDSPQYKDLIKRSEQVDMEYCERLQKDRETIA